jgi:hypothetical protein
MVEQLENKFKKEFNNHPQRWLARLTFEPVYALRNVLSVVPKESQEYSKVLPLAIACEIMKLGAYSVLAYKLAEHFIK